MKRKEAQQILRGLKVTNKFSLKTVGFGFGSAKVLTIKGTVPNDTQTIKTAFRPHGVLVEYASAMFS